MSEIPSFPKAACSLALAACLFVPVGLNSCSDESADARAAAAAPGESVAAITDEQFMALYDAMVAAFNERDATVNGFVWERYSNMRGDVLKVLKGEQQGNLIGVAISMGSVEALAHLVRGKGMRVPNGAILEAVSYGNLDVCKYLLENELVSDAMLGSAMDAACEAGHLDICRYLVEKHGVDAKDVDCLKKMVWYSGADEQARKECLFTDRRTTYEDVYARQVELARYLISCGADASHEDVQQFVDSCSNVLLRDFLKQYAK